MRAIDHPVPYSLEISTSAKWAFVSFATYSFFVFFGTSKPFPDSIPDTSSSNILNQVLLICYLISFLTLWVKQDQVLAFIRQEKFLTILMIWAFLSVFWSDYSFVSLKRWIGLIGEIIVCLAAVLHYRWSEGALRPLRFILLLYFPITILSVMFVHGAIQWEFPAWRGLEDSKNNLGQVALFSLICIIAIIRYHKKKPINILHYALLGMTFAALIGSKSTTSWMIGMMLIGLVGAKYVAQLFRKGFVGLFFVGIIIVGSGIVGAIVVFFAPEILASFLALFGKDLSFTGRVELWEEVIWRTNGKELFGWGLGGFWVMDSPHLISMFQKFVWIPNQAHQGYIDTFNQLGIIGLIFLVLLLINYFRGLARLEKGQWWKWIVIGMIILNFQESIFFRPRHVANYLFVFSYIALFADLVKEKQNQRK